VGGGVRGERMMGEEEGAWRAREGGAHRGGFRTGPCPLGLSCPLLGSLAPALRLLWRPLAPPLLAPAPRRIGLRPACASAERGA